MDDIAEASGITARALYRHYDNKQALLHHVVLEDQQKLLDALEQTPAVVRSDADLNAAVRQLVSAAMASSRLSLLWQREARHLNSEDYARVRARAREIADKFERIFLHDMIPGAGRLTVEIRGWAALSLLTSPGHNPELAVSNVQLRRLLVTWLLRMIKAEYLPSDDVTQAAATAAVPSSRREQLIMGAARLFRRNGYAGVGIDEIGAEAGVAGPAMYRYFESKADVLAATVSRFREWAAIEESRALRSGGDDPRRVLDALLNGYIRVALEAPDLLAVAVNERLYLPIDFAESLGRTQAASVNEWTRWMRAARPELPEQVAQATVLVTRTVVNNIALVPHLRGHPYLHENLAAAASAILFDDESPRGVR